MTWDAEPARRGEHERLDLLEVRIDVLDDRQSERGGLAGAGLGLPDHVPSGEQRRDRLLLDRARRFVADIAQRREYRLGQPELAANPFTSPSLLGAGPGLRLAAAPGSAGHIEDELSGARALGEVDLRLGGVGERVDAANPRVEAFGRPPARIAPRARLRACRAARGSATTRKPTTDCECRSSCPVGSRSARARRSRR